MNKNVGTAVFRKDHPVGPATAEFSSAEMGALAHLYRGEVYRSTIWRTRLDTTTNWAVVVTSVSFTVAFGSAQATALPLVLKHPTFNLRHIRQP